MFCVAILILSRHVAAGPYCGGDSGWAPAAGSVPRHPQLVFWQQDSSILPKGRAYRINQPKLAATIDGKRVALRFRTVRSRDIVVRFIDVASDRTGTLVITDGSADPGTFTIDPSWHVAKPHAATSRYDLMSTRMASRHYDGLAIAVDRAIAFRVRWRRDARDEWRTLLLPAVDRSGTSTALLGETNCQTDDVPIALLERGIELDVSAILPDGSTQHVEGLEGRVVLPSRSSADHP